MKVFLVTRISGNKSIFIFGLSTSPGMFQYILRKTLILFAGCFTTYLTCSTLFHKLQYSSEYFKKIPLNVSEHSLDCLALHRILDDSEYFQSHLQSQTKYMASGEHIKQRCTGEKDFNICLFFLIFDCYCKKFISGGNVLCVPNQF